MEQIIIVDGIPVTVEGDMKEIYLVLHRTVKDPPEVRIKLSKMSKGYQWEISTEGPDPAKVITILQDTDANLRKMYEEEQ